MSLRLLIYGGTSYVERVRIGAWTADTGALGARDGLQDGESFGLGVSDGEPHLIIRTLQNVESRGGYPFTVLFDPGREVWQTFGWNAPALVSVLKRQPAVFTQPETFKVDLAALLPPPAERRAGSSRLRVLLAGSVASELSITVHPRDVGFARRPSVEELYDALSFDLADVSRPCCCVTGLGWLVGGGSALAERLGVRLTIDDDCRTDAATLAECEKAGRQLLADWHAIDRWDATVLADLRDQPPWEWSAGARDVAHRIRLLAALLEPAVPDSVFADLRACEKHGPLAAPLRAAARGVARSGSGPVSSERTRFLAEDGLRFSATLERELVDRMPFDVLVEELASQSIAPDAMPSAIHVPSQVTVELWCRAIAEAADASRLPMLARAAEHLRTWPDIDVSAYQALVDEAVTDTLDLASPDLARLRSDRRFRNPLKKRLAPRVRRTIQAPDYARHAEEQFLWLDDVDVVDEVNRAPNPIERTTEIVNAWLLNLRRRYPAEADARFAALASSPLRLLLKSHMKLEVSRELEVAGHYAGPWGNYLYVHDLYNGADIVKTQPIDETEKAVLREELQQFFVSDQPLATPNLLSLAQLLGPFLPATMEHLRRKENQPDPRAPGFDRWQQGLEWLGLISVRTHNLYTRWWHRLSEGGDTVQGPLRPSGRPHGDAPLGVEWEWLDGKWRTWLFARDLDLSDLKDLDQCLRAGGLPPEVGVLIHDALTVARRADRDVFTARFFEPDRLDRLLALLPDSSLHVSIVEWIASDTEHFRVQYQSRLTRALRRVSSSGRCGAVDQALARFLMSDAAEMKQWQRTLFGAEPGGLQRHLDELMRVPVQDTDGEPPQ